MFGIALGITACALAIAAPIFGALVSRIYAQSELSRVEARLSASYLSLRDTSTTLFAQLQERVTRLEGEMKIASGTHAAVEVAALAADVEKLSASMRKQFGRVFAELHMDGTLKRNAEAQSDETPEQVRARLRVEHGLPKLGGVATGNGKAE